MKKDKILPTPWGVGRGIPGILVCGTKCGVKIISLSLFCGSFPAHTQTHVSDGPRQPFMHLMFAFSVSFFFFWFSSHCVGLAAWRFLLEMQIVMVRYGYTGFNLCDSLTVGNPGRATSKRLNRI